MVSNILRVMHRHSRQIFPPVVLAREVFWKVTLIAPRVASEASKALMVSNWTLGCDAIRSAPGASPPPLSGGTGRDEYGACVGRDRLSPTREGELWWKVCLHPHLEQGGMPPIEKGRWSLFSLLQMVANNSSLTPVNCILKNWDRFDPQSLKMTSLVFLCDTAWPWCPLEDSERWLVGRSLKYNTVLQLDRFCRKQGRWLEVAYVLPFFSL